MQPLPPLGGLGGGKKLGALPSLKPMPTVTGPSSKPLGESNPSDGVGKAAKPSSHGSFLELIEPRRFAIKFEPPTLVMEYHAGGRLRHRRWNMASVTNSASATAKARSLANKLARTAKPGTVSVAQIEALLQRLIVYKPEEEQVSGSLQNDEVCPSGTATGSGLGKSLPSSEPVIDPSLTGDLDLNGVDPEELKLYKERMEEAFNKTAVKPGDPGYQYDVQVDFGEPEADDNEWDEGQEYEDDDFEEDEF